MLVLPSIVGFIFREIVFHFIKWGTAHLSKCLLVLDRSTFSFKALRASDRIKPVTQYSATKLKLTQLHFHSHISRRWARFDEIVSLVGLVSSLTGWSVARSFICRRASMCLPSSCFPWEGMIIHSIAVYPSPRTNVKR